MRLLLATGSAVLLYIGWLFAAEVKRLVIIEFETNPEAEFYEIEWLKEKPSSAVKSPKTERFIEKVTTSPIRRQIAAEYRFFRMRTAAGGYYSRWSEVISLEKATEKLTVQADESKSKETFSSIQDTESENRQSSRKENNANQGTKNTEEDGQPPAPVLPQDDCCFRTVTIAGRPQKVLVGPELPLSELVSESPLYFSLDGGEKKQYQTPIVFRTDGEYRLEIFSRQRRLRTLRFFVDTTPPVTTPGLFQPVIYDGGQLWITGTSRIELKAEDAATGIARVRYRFYRQGDQVPQFRDYSGEFTALPAMAQIEQEVILEFFAEDLNGNRENTKRLVVHVDTLAPRMQLAPQAPKGYHRLLLEEKNPPVFVELWDQNDKIIRKAETRNMLQIPKLPPGRYRAVLSDNFGNRREENFEVNE